MFSLVVLAIAVYLTLKYPNWIELLAHKLNSGDAILKISYWFNSMRTNPLRAGGFAIVTALILSKILLG